MHPRRRFTVPLPGGRSLLLGERTLLMGILNVTPDSFSDGGCLASADAAVQVALAMVEAGTFPVPRRCEIHVGSQDWQSDPERARAIGLKID